MNIQHLKYAVEVEKAASITQAAENLYMSQPNLSKAIKELEAYLGAPIFRRTSKGMIPTAKGQTFLAYAKNILKQVEEMESLYRPSDPSRQVFSLSAPRTGYISMALVNFAEKLDRKKEIELNYKETNATKTINNVVRGEFSLGIIRCRTEHEKYFFGTLDDKEISHEKLWEFDYCVLLNEKSPLALKQEIRPEDLEGMIELDHGDTTVPPASVQQKEIRPAKDSRKIYIYERGSQFDLLSRFTDAYMLTAPEPEELIKKHGVVQKKLTGVKLRYCDILIHLAEYSPTELDKMFLNELKKASRLLMNP